MKKRLYILGVLLFCTLPLIAQEAEEPRLVEGYYSVGDQTFSISIGVQTPLFFNNWTGVAEPALSHVLPGGRGDIDWASYLGQNFTLGGNIGISFMSTVNDRTLFYLPLTLRTTWYFNFDRIDVPVFVGGGFALHRLDEDTAIAPLLVAGTGVYWNYNRDWAFGLKLTWMSDQELYFGNEVPADQSFMGHYLDITLSALYHN